MVPFLVNLNNIYKGILYKVLSSCYLIVLSYFFSTNLVITPSSFSNLSSFNYLTLSIPILGLYINFYSEILYFPYYSLLGNFKYPLLACYLAILLLNTI